MGWRDRTQENNYTFNKIRKDKKEIPITTASSLTQLPATLTVLWETKDTYL